MASFGENVPGSTAFSAESFRDLQEEAKKTIASYDKKKAAAGENVPDWIHDGQYEFVYNFMDARSLLTAYKPCLSFAAISRASGINQTQLSLYANGKKTARPYQVKRIADAIYRIGKELMTVRA